MKKLNYISILLVALVLNTTGCVKDELVKQDNPNVGTSTVLLNEIMSTGTPDWVELYNSGSEAVDLAGYKLSDSGAEWTIEALTIEAGGYVAFDCDKSDVPNISTNFKISSGGEKITLLNAEGELIDEITTPDMSSQLGLAYGRESDGADNWIVLGATKAAANSNENFPPLIIADELSENDVIYKVDASDGDGIGSVKLILATEGSVQSLDMALLEGSYSVSIPRFEEGTKVGYYVKATDNTGLVSYYPESAPSELNSYYVTGGKAIFLSVDYTGTTEGNRGDVNFSIAAYDHVAVTEVKLYYVIPGQTIDDKEKVSLELVDGLWIGTIPSQAEGSVVQYYLRAKNDAGKKSYYPIENADFDHDVLDTWPSYMVGDEVVIINGFSQFSTTDPVAGSDLVANVHVAYDNGDVEEVKFYYIVNYDAATYNEDTDRKSIKWAGDLPSSDNFYNFTIPNAEFVVGDKISWYLRAKDGAGDKKYFTLGQDDNFDKGVIEDWNVVEIK